MAVLKEAEVKQKLAKLSGWQLKGLEIEKVYELDSFKPAIAFVNRVAEAAETAQHHPDIAISYNKVRLTLSTHSEGGVTEKDVEMAGRIEALAKG